MELMRRPSYPQGQAAGLPRLGNNLNRPSSRGSLRRSSSSAGGAEVVMAPNSGMRRSMSSPMMNSPTNLSNLTVSIRATPSIGSVLGNGFGPSTKDALPFNYNLNVGRKCSENLNESMMRTDSKHGGHQSPLENLEAVLFLDVDGVLHPVQVTHPRQQFDKRCMTLFAEVMAKTDATIVLSTAWRADPEARRMIADKLHEYNLPLYVSKTPQIAMFRRTREIFSWVKKYRPQTWVAIDDLPLEDEDPEFMGGHFVHTRARFGLQHDTAQLAIELLRAQRQQLNAAKAASPKAQD